MNLKVITVPLLIGQDWSQEMEDYCIQDVTRYHQTMAPLPTLPEWVTLEHEVQRILTAQESHGWTFDQRRCMETCIVSLQRTTRN